MKKLGLNILFSVLFTSLLFSQVTTMTIESVDACPDEYVLVPINVTSFYDIGALTLFVGYDTTVLTFVGHLNENPETQGIFSNAMTSPTSQVGISWSSLNPANISDGKLVDLKFYYIDSTCNLTFNEGCELVNSTLEVVYYTADSGLASPAYPLINLNPENSTVDEGDDASFSIYALEVDSYQWQISLDNGFVWTDLQNGVHYSGVNSSNLTVKQVQNQMDESQFRVFLCNEYCCTYSAQAELSVNSLSLLSNQVGHNKDILNVYPNPFCSDITFSVTMKSKGKLIITIFDLLGNEVSVIKQKRDAGEYEINYQGQNFANGVYFCHCKVIGSNGDEVCIKRLIKNRD